MDSNTNNTRQFKCKIKRMWKNCPKPNTGWFGCFAHIRGEDDDIKLIGIAPTNLINGMELQINAHWNTKFEAWEADSISIITKTTKGIKTFLSSIPGISLNTAELLTLKFGNDTIRMIQEHPDEVELKTGISREKLHTITTSIRNADTEGQIRTEFPELSDKLVKRICKIYRKKDADNIIDMIRDNPYCLSNIPGISFPVMDAIALRSDNDPLSPFRINHALVHLLKNDTSGNTYINLTDKQELRNLMGQLERMLHIQFKGLQEFSQRIIQLSLVKNPPITIEYTGTEYHLYLTNIYDSIKNSAEILANMLKDTGCYKTDPEKAMLKNTLIPNWCKTNGIQLTHEQNEAVKSALCNRISIITGGPGRGKTKIIKCIADIYRRTTNAPIYLLAPTGKAVNKLSNDTGKAYETMTVDRFLLRKQPKIYGQIPMVIIDESSMLDVIKASELLQKIATWEVCFVGDVDQLPPIGPGNFLKDLIDSKKLPTSVITKSLRNAKIIAENADKINAMDTDLRYDFNQMPFFPQQEENEEMLEFILDQYNDERDQCPDITQIALLAPMRKGIAGVINLNLKIQEIACPEITGASSAMCVKRNRRLYATKGFPLINTIYGNESHYTRFRIGDIVINTKNNGEIQTCRYTNDDYLNGDPIYDSFDQGIFNGDCGRIIAYDDGKTGNEEETVIVQMFDGRVAELNLPIGEFEHFELGYAMTVHKAQGCEYETVIYISPKSMEHMTILGFANKNLIYTAVTRAKQRTVIIGSKEALNACIENPIPERHCDLAQRI